MPVLVLQLQKELDKQFPHKPFDAKSLLNTRLSSLGQLPKEGIIFEFGFGRFQQVSNGLISDFLHVIHFASNGHDGFVSFLEGLGR